MGHCRPHTVQKLELSSETGPVGTFKVHPKETLRTQFVPKGPREKREKRENETRARLIVRWLTGERHDYAGLRAAGTAGDYII